MMVASQVKDELPSCIRQCCNGSYSDIKGKLLNSFVCDAKRTRLFCNREFVAKNLQYTDPRWSMIRSIINKIEEETEETVETVSSMFDLSFSITRNKNRKKREGKTKHFQTSKKTWFPKALLDGDEGQVHTALNNSALSREIKDLIDMLTFTGDEDVPESRNKTVPGKTVQSESAFVEIDQNKVKYCTHGRKSCDSTSVIADEVYERIGRLKNSQFSENGNNSKSVNADEVCQHVDRSIKIRNSTCQKIHSCTPVNTDEVFQNKSRLLFDDLAWEVECTRDVWNILKSKKLHPDMKNKIIQKIVLLAKGEWSRNLSKRLEGVSNGIKLYEAKINKGSRILWEVAIAFSVRCSMFVASPDAEFDSEVGAVYVDKIRIWNIALQHDDVPKMIESIVHSHKRGKECLIKKNLRLNGLLQVGSKKLPNSYMNEISAKQVLSKRSKNEDSKSNNGDKYLFSPPASPNEQEYNILKFYAFNSNMASRLLSLTHSQFDFPFQVSELEHTIIHLEPENKCSILLLGRSGTGKTTCCLYRLWSCYQSYWNVASHFGPNIPKRYLTIDNEIRYDGDKFVGSGDGESLKQKLTMSSRFSMTEESNVAYANNYLGPCSCGNLTLSIDCVTCDTTRNGNEWKSDLSSDNNDIDCADKPSQEDCQSEHLRQLFVTKNEVLCHEIETNFHDLCQGGHLNFSQESIDDYQNIKNIPAARYPLFLTAKDLLVLLDGSLDGEQFFIRDLNGKMVENVQGWGRNRNRTGLFYFSFEAKSGTLKDDNFEKSKDHQEQILEKRRRTHCSKMEVTYEVFANEIWPKILRGKKNDCHSSLVWMEIISFIKGCVESFLNESGYLTEEEYQYVGRKRAPNFTGDRHMIYNFFLDYEKIKKKLGYFDEMDVYFHVYKRLRKCMVPVWGFHQIYVDEAQDFTQAELLLLLRCSLNPNAMFFSGDTAQSIMNGVAFRFCDLQSLFFVAKQELERNKIMSTVVVPKKVHQLTHNYRSHRGILKLASVVVQYLTLLFPESFDHLRPDVGLFPGPKPVILDVSNIEELAKLLKGNKRETSAIEFGAQQVIIVQNEQSKKDLPAVLSDCLVLSIYEAKGLEFNDVLIYNFFKDSQASDEWRVIATKIGELKEEEECERNLQIITEDMLECKTRPLTFGKNKHKLLNAELKKFYTAVTRARVHVWIYDEDKVKRMPMFEMFIKKSLVQVVKLDREVGNKGIFVEQSSSEEWKEKGIYFYGNKRWKLALQCFEKAGDEMLAGKCHAQIQAEIAERLAHQWKFKGNNKQLQDVYTQYKRAAKLFLLSGLYEEAKICLKNSMEWSSLATICEKQGKFSEAVMFFQKVGGNEEDVLRCLKKAGDISAIVDFLKTKVLIWSKRSK